MAATSSGATAVGSTRRGPKLVQSSWNGAELPYKEESAPKRLPLRINKIGEQIEGDIRGDFQQRHKFGRAHIFCQSRSMCANSAKTIAMLSAEIKEFCEARDWQQFHSPKELATAIILEAGELLQHFLWLDPAQVAERMEMRKTEISAEMADVAILLLELANHTNVDLAEAIQRKIKSNNDRYPVERAKGSNKKYNEL